MFYNDLANFSKVGHVHDWSSIINKPSTFTPTSHNHDTLYAPIDQIVYTTTDPGENVESTLPNGTLICIYEEV